VVRGGTIGGTHVGEEGWQQLGIERRNRREERAPWNNYFLGVSNAQLAENSKSQLTDVTLNQASDLIVVFLL
jgi:hypothetical protein